VYAHMGEGKALFAGYMKLQADTPIGQGLSPSLECITLKTPKKTRELSSDVRSVIIPQAM
jgi:hypothetical protein